MTAGPQNKDWGQSRSKHQNNEKTTPRTHANTWMHKNSDLTTPPHASHIFCPALAFTNQRCTHIMLQKRTCRNKCMDIFSAQCGSRS